MRSGFPYSVCKKTLLNSALTAALGVSLSALSSVHADTIEPVYSPDGVHYVSLDIAEIGQAYDKFDFFGLRPAERDLFQYELYGLRLGFNYFWDVLKDDYRAREPINILLIPYTDRDDNASAVSLRLEGSSLTELGALWTGDVSSNPHAAYITIDQTSLTENWYVDHLPVLPIQNYESDLPGTMLHELFHAFGLNASTVIEDGRTEIWQDYYIAYDDFLHDAFGRNLGDIARAAGGQPVSVVGIEPGVSSDSIEIDPTAFYVRYVDRLSEIYFSGPAVDEVLNGALIAWPTDSYYEESELPQPVPGLPINGYEGIGTEYELFDGSHIELQNSLMSHQWYTNWCVLMEAELAVLQDIGYKIDRKRFFGHSIYNNNLALVNNNGYWARNASGTDWLKGVASTQDWGIGLHVYGSGNTISQRADLLSDGRWGIGARIDGSENNLTIDSAVHIQANGYGGKGILFSWGKGHNLTIEAGASVEATGENGIAVNFDFGSNEMGDYYGYFGSYTAVFTFKSLKHLPEVLKGALVDEFRLGGEIKGSAASIYISPNAYVKNIVIEPGAKIEGDIVSDWDPDETLYGTRHSGVDEGNLLITNLIFGNDRKTRINSISDDAVEFSDMILGPKSLALVVNEATLRFGGVANVLNVTVTSGSTLEGGTYYLNDKEGLSGSKDRLFLNAGHLVSSANAPVTIHGNYVQQNGTLTLSVRDGQYIPLSVSRTAQLLDGSQVIATLEGSWVSAGDVTVDTTSPVVDADSVDQGELIYSYKPAVQMQASPTLRIQDNENGQGWTVARPSNAYSQYVLGDAREVAGIFDQSASTLKEESLKDFFAQLDWSASDGRDIAQAAQALSGDGVMDSIGGMMSLERMAKEALSGHFDFEADGDYAWVSPFGAIASAKTIAKARMNVVGIAGGWIKKSADQETALSVAALNSEGSSANASQLDAKGIWLAGSWRQNAINASGLFVQTQASVGYVNGDQKRSVSSIGLADSIESDVDYWSLGLDAKSGLNFKVNDSVQIEPFVGVAGTILYAPSYDEKADGFSALAVDSNVYRSLEAQIGVKLQGFVQKDNKAYWEIHTHYGRELFSDAGDMKASFVHPDLKGSFDRTVEWDSKNRVQAGVKLGIESQKGLSISARINADWLSSDTHSLAGGIQAQWKF